MATGTAVGGVIPAEARGVQVDHTCQFDSDGVVPSPPGQGLENAPEHTPADIGVGPEGAAARFDGDLAYQRGQRVADLGSVEAELERGGERESGTVGHEVADGRDACPRTAAELGDVARDWIVEIERPRGCPSREDCRDDRLGQRAEAEARLRRHRPPRTHVGDAVVGNGELAVANHAHRSTWHGVPRGVLLEQLGQLGAPRQTLRPGWLGEADSAHLGTLLRDTPPVWAVARRGECVRRLPRSLSAAARTLDTCVQ